MDWLGIVLRLALGFGSLVGVAALVAALINILKVVGLVKDNTAGQWSAVLNLIFFGVLIYFGIFQPQLATEVLDGYAGQIAMILLFVVGYLTQIVTAPAVHTQLKAMRLPVLGASHSN